MSDTISVTNAARVSGRPIREMYRLIELGKMPAFRVEDDDGSLAVHVRPDDVDKLPTP